MLTSSYFAYNSKNMGQYGSDTLTFVEMTLSSKLSLVNSKESCPMKYCILYIVQHPTSNTCIFYGNTVIINEGTCAGCFCSLCWEGSLSCHSYTHYNTRLRFWGLILRFNLIYFPSDWNVVFSLVKTWHVTTIYISMSDRWKFISGKYGQCVISISILVITSCICPTKCGPRENKTLIRLVTDFLQKYIGLINLIDA